MQNGNTQTSPNILCYFKNISMLQYKKRKMVTQTIKRGEFAPESIFQAQNGNTH